MASQQESLQEAREEHEAAHERPVLEVTPDRTELRAVGSAVIKPASEPCRQQFGAPAPINTPSPSSWIPCMPRTCSTARTQHEVGHCSETQHSSPSVGSSLPCGRLGEVF
ncbi:uncharacterized protein LOC125942857 [Dermacentor silvarum]|uniref:uncharacterized protein LOC125942857 n=1 Tax=Dermacentor silvarum TaxID=543639 RepID=UPI0021007F76|nr:uncharacterized protein LOC125942857 [Dermacentor silvarum]